MRLHDFQSLVGRSICEPHKPATDLSALPSEEYSQLTRLLRSPGFAFTRAVQQSWCEGRVALLAQHTLSTLPTKRRNSLIYAWIEQSGGRNTFGSEEAIRFLEFIARQLHRNSASFYWCLVEQAIYRASMGRHAFSASAWPRDRFTMLARGDCATLVTPSRTLRWNVPSLFFAPGLTNLAREAAPLERLLWKQLALVKPVDAFPHVVQITALKEMLSVGIVTAIAASPCDI